jgi:hypothetical protein
METEIFVTGGKIGERHGAARKVPFHRLDFFISLTEDRRKGLKEMIAEEKRHFRGVIDFVFILHQALLAAIEIIFSKTSPGLFPKRGGGVSSVSSVSAKVQQLLLIVTVSIQDRDPCSSALQS